MGTIRDIAIIIVALFDIILLALLIAIAFIVWRLMKMLLAEIPPVIGSAKRTTTTVEGTVDFMSTTAARPLIRAVSLLYATTRFVQILFMRRGGG